MSSLKRQLEFAVRNNLNFLVEGKHGVGKTTMIVEVFKELGYNYLVYSGATMDAYVNFVGIPFKGVDGNLEFALPKELATGNIDAIFIDEFNRAPKQVRNALMELIQFKSINGRPFPNLKVIGAAINPANDTDMLEYDVEVIDPAQLDRFHMKLDMPYMVDEEYFLNKYAGNGLAACKWWKSLSKDHRLLCSPRRLDYALEVFNLAGDLHTVLDNRLHIAGLVGSLKHGDISIVLKQCMENGEYDRVRKMINDPSNIESLEQNVIEPIIRSVVPGKPETVTKAISDLSFARFFEQEYLLRFADQRADVSGFMVRILDEYYDDPITNALCQAMYRSNLNSTMISNMKRFSPNKLYADFAAHIMSGGNTPAAVSSGTVYPSNGKGNTDSRVIDAVEEFNTKCTNEFTQTTERVSSFMGIINELDFTETCNNDLVEQLTEGFSALVSRSQVSTLAKIKGDLENLSLYIQNNGGEFSNEVLTKLGKV